MASTDTERRRMMRERVEQDEQRKQRFRDARAKVQAFAGPYTDLAAMAYIMLEWQKGAGNVTPAMVKNRVRQQYPWVAT